MGLAELSLIGAVILFGVIWRTWIAPSRKEKIDLIVTIKENKKDIDALKSDFEEHKTDFENYIRKQDQQHNDITSEMRKGFEKIIKKIDGIKADVDKIKLDMKGLEKDFEHRECRDHEE